MRRVELPLLVLVSTLLIAASGPDAAVFKEPLVASAEVVVTRGVVFGEAVNNRGELQVLRLDLFEPPAGTPGGDVRPALIWVHGGGFKDGNRTDGNIQFLATEFARRGWVTASIDYRLRPGGTPGSQPNSEIVVEEFATGENEAIRDAYHDLHAAVRWVRANADALDIDDEHIVVGGGSAGAVTALFAHFNADDPGTSGNPGFSSSTAAAVSLWGAANPRDIEPGDGPIVMFHGAQDTTVPYALGAQTCAAQSAVLNACDLTTYPEDGHGPWRHREEIVRTTASQLCARLPDMCDPPPVLNLPEQIDDVADDPRGTVVSFDVDAQDPDGGNVTVTCDPTSGSQMAVGTTIVDCVAVDDEGDRTSGSFPVGVTVDAGTFDGFTRLVEQLGLGQGMETAFTGKTARAADAYRDGDVAAARDALHELIELADAQEGRHISQQQADDLRVWARTLLDATS